jgi:uncharacterized LabA/DUF88 family protein
VSVIQSDEVHLFVDYQNVHLSIFDSSFAPPLGTQPHQVLVHPGRFGDAVMKVRDGRGLDGRLTNVRVYRGSPSQAHQPTMYSYNQAQAAEWSRDPRVTVHSRTLRYPRNWPQDPAKEKGIDVKLGIDLVRCALQDNPGTIILASRDTDLVPALEMARDLGKARLEVVTWKGCSRLRFRPGEPTLWCTYLEGADYLASKGPRQY